MLKINYIIAFFTILVTFFTSCENLDQNNKNSPSGSLKIDQFKKAIDEYPFFDEKLNLALKDSCLAYYSQNNYNRVWFKNDSIIDSNIAEFYNYLNNDTSLNIPFNFITIPQGYDNESFWSKEIHLFLRCTAYLSCTNSGIYNFTDSTLSRPESISFQPVMEFIENKPDELNWTEHLISFKIKNKAIISLHKAINEFTSKFILNDTTCSIDTSKVDTSLKVCLNHYGYEVADDSLRFIQALKDFQYNNGLLADGVLGKNTYEAINKSNLERYYQSIITLDQLRQYADTTLPEKIIRVNIPTYILTFINSDTVAFKSRVVVGAQKTKTPTFQTKAKYIVTNPYWNVPHSIASKEIVYSARRDTNLFNSKGYELIKNNKVINHDSIDWSKYHKNNFPFKIRQKYGPLNSLGKVKLLFPNKHMVYIHDTPSKRLFSTSVRSYSHGCIRTEYPDSLAKLILSFEDHAYADSIDTLYTRDKETYLRLNDQFLVSIEYQTVLVDDSTGRLRVYPDIYGRLEDFIELSKQ